ncbi:hypothetical protein ACWYXK_14100 [Janthinobacterium lividum]
MQIKISPKKILLCLLILSPACYVAACCVFSNTRKAAFYQVQTGDTRQAVLASFGKLSYVERPGGVVGRYSRGPCTHPCAERLWFENRLSSDLEAWSIDLDQNGRVVDKLYLVSL